MTRQKKKAAQPGIPTEATGFYRCPACGEKVDQESQEEIRLHHSHLRHRDGLAQRFDLSRAPYHHAAQTWILGKPRGCS
ncbi:MAG: hypothetical protein ACJ8NS_08150 [Chthoniobacterales bacterium]